MFECLCFFLWKFGTYPKWQRSNNIGERITIDKHTELRPKADQKRTVMIKLIKMIVFNWAKCYDSSRLDWGEWTKINSQTDEFFEEIYSSKINWMRCDRFSFYGGFMNGFIVKKDTQIKTVLKLFDHNKKLNRKKT